MRNSASSTGRAALARRATAWACVFALGVGATLGAEAGIGVLWRAFSQRLGTFGAVATMAVLLAVVSLAAAVLQGRMQLPARQAQLRLAWATRMVPYVIRDLGGVRGVSSGRRNRRWRSLTAFEAEDPRRSGGPDSQETDFGKHWRDRGRYADRVTYIHDTGEVVAVAAGRHGGSVELLAIVSTEYEVERRLADWSYATLGGRDLRWVRRRLYGWAVPLSPRGQRWLEEDEQPPRPWPAPPAPSVGQTAGAYHGRERGHEHQVLCVDQEGERHLYHTVEHSPTGYAWGYSGAGPTDLARSLLLDRLGYVPQRRIVFALRDEVVAGLDDSFVLTYEQVDNWIDGHAGWFAENPRAEPLDPYAAGGAD